MFVSSNFFSGGQRGQVLDQRERAADVATVVGSTHPGPLARRAQLRPGRDPGPHP